MSHIYKLENVTVHIDQIVKYLLMSDDSVVSNTDNTGEVASPPADEQFPNTCTVVHEFFVVLSRAK